MSGRMISRRSVLALAACTALGAVGCSKTEEYTGPELILRYAENQPEDYPTTQAALAFADLVAERTEGRVKVVVYSGGELGAEQSVIEQMQYGGIDFARVSLSQLAEYQPALSVLQLPFLYTDAPQMWRVQESDMMSEMILDLGAKPAQVVYSRVYAALHNAEIDGAENNWPSYEAMGHYEVAPYFLKDEHARVPELQLASEAAMEKLAELDERFPDIIRACGKESALTERRLWAEREASAEKHMREWGVEVTTLSAAEKARFRAAVEPMYAAFEEQSRLIQRIREA